MCPMYWQMLLSGGSSLDASLYPAPASQLCVGGCYFVREAVGILNSPVIISEEMHIMVVWQQQSEVTQFRISAEESHLVARALSQPLFFLLQLLRDVEVLWGGPSVIPVCGWGVSTLFEM